MSEQPAASQVTRLPGIESFDHVPPSSNRQQGSPMMVDGSPRPPSSGRPSDAGLHQNLTRLDITAANAPTEIQWQAAQMSQMPPHGYVQAQPTTMAPQQMHQHSASMPEPVTPKRNKRQAWYGGPVTRPSPEDSGSSDGVPTPGTSQGTEFHPVIVNTNQGGEAYPQGAVMTEEQKVYLTQQEKPEPARADSGFQSFVQGQAQQPPQTYALQAGHDPHFAANYTQQASNDMGRLEALVAVATSENRAVERS